VLGFFMWIFMDFYEFLCLFPRGGHGGEATQLILFKGHGLTGFLCNGVRLGSWGNPDWSSFFERCMFGNRFSFWLIGSSPPRVNRGCTPCDRWFRNGCRGFCHLDQWFRKGARNLCFHLDHWFKKGSLGGLCAPSDSPKRWEIDHIHFRFLVQWCLFNGCPRGTDGLSRLPNWCVHNW
jgi:uncharacterized membrane protein YhdT